MSEKILIISYVFPPSKGIGGRRWAKIAKHWHRQGNDVEVISGYNKNDSGGPWYEDVAELNKQKRIHYIPDIYPRILKSIPGTFYQKLQYRIALKMIKLKVKGNYYDRSVFWKKRILPLVRQKIKEGFTNVVATGAPFFYLKSIVWLKKEFPDLKVWVDLRDPWTWGDGYGMTIIGSRRKNIEVSNQKEVVLNADLLSVPIRKMYKELNQMYNSTELKIIPHFYDPDDIPKKRMTNPNFDLNLIYAGTVYDGIENALLLVAKELLKIKNKRIRWRFFVSNPRPLNILFSDKKYKKLIEINSQISSSEIQQEIYNSDFYIAVYPEKFKDHLSTKFPELYALGIPIIYIGNIGEIAGFIAQNKLGAIIKPNDIKSEIKEILLNPPVMKKALSSDKFTIETIVGNSFSENLIKDVTD